MREDTKTITFAAIVCVVCSLLLSGTAAMLKSRQESNEAFDVQRNIVKAFGVDTGALKRPQIEETYTKHVTEKDADGLTLYTWIDEGADAPSKYAFPISGKGLWGDVFGYMALNADLETIAGVSFYKHKETPGLGAEIEKEWFLSQFTGKRIYSNGTAADFRVCKPGSTLDDSAVDGISGATLTGNGIQDLIRKDAATYAPYFKSIQGK